MKKLIILIVILVLLCGCAAQQGPKTVETDEVTYKQLPFETLELYLTYSSTVYYDLNMLEYCNAILSSRCEDIMNTKINIHFLPNIPQYDDELKSVFNAGLPVDIFLGVDGMIYGLGEKPVEKWVDMGVAANITDLVGIYYPSACVNIEKYKDRVSKDGSIYGIPIVFNSVSAYGIWMPADLNKDVPILSSFNDVTQVFDLAMSRDLPVFISLSSLYDIWAAGQGYSRFNSFLIDQYKHKVYPIEETDLFSDIYDLVQGYYKYSNSQYYECVDCVKIVSYSGLRTYNLPLSQKHIQANRDYVLRLIDIEDSFNNLENVRGVIMIGETSIKKERALMFLDIVYNNEELSKIFLYGVEEKSYKKNEKGSLIDSQVGLWGDTIANMKFDDLPYEFDLDYRRYQEVVKDDRIGSYRRSRLSRLSVYDMLTEEEKRVYDSRAYINWVDRLEKLYTENSVYEIVTGLREKNTNALEESIAKYLWD